MSLRETRKLSDYIKPMLAKESAEAFDDESWIFEIKWDGYRAIAEMGKEVRLYSRNGNSFLDSYPVITDALKKIRQNAVIDGEIVILNEDGLPDFQKLQHYESNTHMPICFYAFDILQLGNKSLVKRPLLERKQLLQKFLGNNRLIRYSDHIVGKGKDFFKVSESKNLEGIMAKKADSEYFMGRRTNEWLKIKNNKTADVIIAGYTSPAGSRNHFGSLVLGIRDGKKLKHAGNAGTGYNEKKLSEIFQMLQPIRRVNSPFDENIRIPGVTWVEPQYICEVKFTEWTREGKLRHPVYLRLRTDKKLNEVDMSAVKPVKHVIEKQAGKKAASEVKKIVADKSNAAKQVSEKINDSAKKADAKKGAVKKSGAKKAAEKKSSVKNEETQSSLKFGKISVNISNRQKIYFPDDNITKGMVVDYYQSIADYILPYLKNRPESLKRNPGGITDGGFFHKDAGEGAPSWIKSFKVHSESTNKKIDYIICNDKATLAYLNNLGCIELNPWHSVISKEDNPDYMIIDIDPSDNNTFEQVIEAAQQFKIVLDKAGAKSFCKTSGASGLHIYVPMGKKYTYEQVKDFAHLLCMIVSDQLPDFTTLERNLKKRGDDKMYLDYLQNRRGQTIASVYSLRPKKGATVSMPLNWKEVKTGLKPSSFNIHNALARIKKTGDIFSGIFGPATNINQCLKNLGQ